eukprot:3311953-Pleurochrysis_carterae.AAC.11
MLPVYITDVNLAVFTAHLCKILYIRRSKSELHKTAVNQSVASNATLRWRGRGEGTLGTKSRWGPSRKENAISI